MLLGINYIQIDDTNVNSIISEIQMQSFGYEKKLIVVKNSGLFKKSKAVGRRTTKTDNTLADKISGFIEENILIMKQRKLKI